MGAAESTEASSQLGTRTGYHVLKVKPGSPADEAGVQAFFDYIVAINGLRLDQDSPLLMDTIRSNVNQKVTLTLFNSKFESFREISMVPSSLWGGDGLLGCSIRFCSFERAGEYVWHIVDVYANSPASQAGLIAGSDYIIGSPDVVLQSKDDLFAMIEQSVGQPVRLFIYNWKTDQCREVTITPNLEWGGDGLLGCDIGFGILHRIPKTQFDSTQALPTTAQSVKQPPNKFEQMPATATVSQ